MHSIDTYYDRNYFRSRLEARWAVFFNKAGIKYQYEPQGFKSDSGEMYLPDFYLPETYLRKSKGVYVEIKSDYYEDTSIPAAEWFQGNLVLFKETPDLSVWDSEADDQQKWHHNKGFQQTEEIEPGVWEEFWDNYMRFRFCASCGISTIDFHNDDGQLCPDCGSPNWDIEKGNDAALAANMARFEHKNKVTKLSSHE